MSFPVTVIQYSLTWQATQAALAAAVAKAEELGVKVNIALVDSAGVLAGFLRMPGAPLHSVEIAVDKAYTSVSFGLPTSSWAQELAHHSPPVQQGLILRPRFIAFGGGVPIVTGQGQIIGGIGVSGATEEQDEIIALAGVEAITCLENRS